MADDLDRIDDLFEIFEIMKALHIPTRGLEGLNETRAKLRQFLEESATRRVSEVSTLFLGESIQPTCMRI